MSDKGSACQCRRHKRCRFDPWVGKIPWKRKWQPTPASLSGKSQGQRSLAGYSPRVTKSQTQLNNSAHTTGEAFHSRNPTTPKAVLSVQTNQVPCTFLSACLGSESVCPSLFSLFKEDMSLLILFLFQSPYSRLAQSFLHPSSSRPLRCCYRSLSHLGVICIAVRYSGLSSVSRRAGIILINPSIFHNISHTEGA